MAVEVSELQAFLHHQAAVESGKSSVILAIARDVLMDRDCRCTKGKAFKAFQSVSQRRMQGFRKCIPLPVLYALSCMSNSCPSVLREEKLDKERGQETTDMTLNACISHTNIYVRIFVYMCMIYVYTFTYIET